MVSIAVGLIPVICLILIGYGLKQTFLSMPVFWKGLESLVYFLLFKALIIHSLGSAPLRGMDVIPLALSLLLASFIISGLLLFWKPYLRFGNAAFTSIFMGSTRFNTYIGIAVAGSLYGETGLVIAAIVIAVLVPQVNIFSILVLTKFSSAEKFKKSRWQQLLLIASNPLILASGAGIFLSLRYGSLPPVIDNLIADLGATSIPLGLMAVGAGLKTKGLYSSKKFLMWTSVFKLLLMPLIIILTCNSFGVEATHTKVAVLFGSLPAASTAYVLSRQLGGDAPLMAAIITITTIASVLTMPIFLLF